MTPFLNFDPDLDSHFIEKDNYIEMKWFRCGYEEELPNFVYGEEAAYLKEIGVSTPPCFHCIQCRNDTLYRKGIKLPKNKINR